MRAQVQNQDGVAAQAVHNKWITTRRDFLKASVLAGLAPAAVSLAGHAGRSGAKRRFGIVADPHYADADRRGNRYYRESINKMTECTELMNEQEVDFLVELGDLKDQDSPPLEEATLRYLRDIEQIFQQFKGPKYHVIGNHDVDSISKEQFLANTMSTNIPAKSTYYSFHSKGVHFVVLDANYRADGSAYDHGNFNWRDAHVTQAQLTWLKHDLESTPQPVIVFVHQQLDGKGDYCVNNAEEVRKVLQASGKVLAVFQGHNHKGRYSWIEAIHYYTLKAMVDGSGRKNNSYAIVEIFEDNNIVVTGYRRAKSKKLPQI